MPGMYITWLEVVNQLAYLETPGVLMVGALTETEASWGHQWVLEVRPPDHVVVVTWTGLIQVTPVSQRRPLPLSRWRCVQICRVVMAHMACDVPRDEGWLGSSARLLDWPRRPRTLGSCSAGTVSGRGYCIK